MRDKYAELIDAETWAFIDATYACYPADTAEQSIQRQRQIYDAMCAQFYAGRPAGVLVEDSHIAAMDRVIPVRHYRLKRAVARAQVLYFHGGGFVVGGLHSHDDVCAEICAHTGLEVTAVDYRLAPEHVFPAAFDDALTSYCHVAQAGELPVILAGDSAGGNLAAAVSYASRELEIKPLGQLLIYPGLGSDFTQGTYLEHANAPMLTTADVLFYRDMLSGGVDMAGNPYFSPLAADDFSGLPPTVVITAQCDPLAGDGAAYCARINAAGGRAWCTEEAGLVHGYLRARHSVGRARDSFVRIVNGLDELSSI